MFVRKKKNRSGSISVQIIKKISSSNKVLKTIGSSSNPQEIDRLFQKALYELPRLYGATLFDKVEEPKISDLSYDNIRIIGPNLFLEGFLIISGLIKLMISFLRT